MVPSMFASIIFFFNDTATTEIYTLSLHDALPIYFGLRQWRRARALFASRRGDARSHDSHQELAAHRARARSGQAGRDRKSTRLNSSHANISYAVFCLKKKNESDNTYSVRCRRSNM